MKRTAMCIKSSLSSIIPKNLQAGYNMANPQLPLSELAGRYKETGSYFKLTTSPPLLDSRNIPPWDLTVCVSVLTGSQCAEKLVASGVEPKVVVATNVNPKLVGGCVFLNE
ncbi:hypothetical protein HID58_037486 [Brassica napus]|uniref:Uncharacterized protein n=1 Tax=Brassica napus TaxID=3708 RepID=A0ABQ8BLG6_BRANA|nr:hypothetical protein HID58_037486 [Brassica napus]